VAETPVRRCLAARVEWTDDDPIAHAYPLDARPDLRNRPGHLVPDHLRNANTVIHAAVGDVQVGAADPAERNIEADLTRAWGDPR
jgi:hypothetical protein